MTPSAQEQQAVRPAGLRRGGRSSRRRRRISILGIAVIGIGIAAVAGPLYWMVTASFKGPAEVVALNPTLVPQDPTSENYTGLLTGSMPFPAFFLNSLLTASVTALIATFIATMAGYSFSRSRYRLRGPLSLAILAVQMLPYVVLIGPLYLLMQNFGLLNTYTGLILGYTTFALPFGAWMMKSFIDGVPLEIEEAARVDGYSRFGILVLIVIPLTVPGLAATAVIIFINSWNNLLYPLTLMTDINRQTLPPGLLQSFSGQYQFDWGGMMAATTVTSVPLVVAFFAIQRYMVRGLTGGSLAGT